MLIRSKAVRSKAVRSKAGWVLPDSAVTSESVFLPTPEID